jgi:hypothetical protein
MDIWIYGYMDIWIYGYMDIVSILGKILRKLGILVLKLDKKRTY